MGKFRGFMLKHRVTTLFRCMFRRRRSTARYRRLDPIPSWGTKSISRLLSWTQRLKTRAKAICNKAHCSRSGRSYMQIGQDPIEKEAVTVPKGHLAVYVGQKDGDYRRVLVPVIYINHPLFTELLRDAEEEYGFNHPGGITIPCRISEFERVQTRIKQGRVR
ncbi:auxin-responsive protein SAUR36-like [Nicotiana tabacum]|uniref:Auxin-responsive protein SAUR36-like n=1 Tax=Nicotiana tabacum TaxID=4097 RepID=A0A1S4CW85_TOBAC|nr:auxin-responsive protein SAUR36-like [Nicotiana tomentosiformis]XP_016505269.1 PREDICTED: auxin-responsive protein SAUR36-like [Nicotiana tabacum]